MKNIFHKWNLIPILITSAFFAGFLLVGISIYRDYGTFVDEYPQMNIAQRNYDFLKRGDPTKFDFPDWEHGAAFEVLTIYSTRFLARNFPFSDLFYLRHLDVFLFFWISSIGFFLLVKYKFKSWMIGLLGTSFLYLSPVIFGNAFYNSKDIPLLSVYILGLFTLVIFLERPNVLTAALHALMCAFLINIRIPGVILPALTVGALGLELVAANRRQIHPRLGRTLIAAAVFIVLTVGLTILFFPASWSDPFHRFIDAYIAMTHRSWTCCCNLLMGGCFTSDAIPWYYVPAWMGVTTPIFYLVLFLIGLAAALVSFLVHPWNHMTPEKRSAVIYLGALILPLAAVIIGRAVIYNGWRHLYFIYAPFLILALDGFVALYRFLKVRLQPRLAASLLGLVTLVSFATTAVVMIQSHPYENIYFNFLAGTDPQQIKQNYELDYWGLSYIEGMRYILVNDPRPGGILLATNQTHITEFSFMLPEAQQTRLAFTNDPTRADYFMSNYYLHPGDYDYPNEVFSIKVGGAKILSVFKLK